MPLARLLCPLATLAVAVALAGPATAGAAPAHLVRVSPAVAPVQAAAGDAFAYRVVVRNRGTRPSSALRLTLHLAPRTGRGRGVRLASSRLRPVRPGRTAAVRLTARVPRSATPGNHRLVTCLLRTGVKRSRIACVKATGELRVVAPAAPAPPAGPTPPPPAPVPTAAPFATPTATPTVTPTATPTVTPTPPPTPQPNRAPVAANDAITTDLGETSTSPAPGVLGNDTDADGDDLTAELVTSPTHGTLVLGADGSVTYVPDAGYIGADQFTYRASDGAATSAPATVAIQVRGADLAAGIAADDTTPDVGDTVTLAVTASNAGPDDVTDAAVAVPLPAGLTLVSGPTGYDAATGTWAVGALASGASRQEDLVVTVTAAARPSVLVSATVSGGPGDPDAADDEATVTLTPTTVDLGVAVSVSTSTPNVGDVVTFTVRVQNTGDLAATGVAVDASLPDGLSLVSATPSQGSYDPSTGAWILGTVAVDGSATLGVLARVTAPDPVALSAAVGAVNEPDGNPANDTGSAQVTPQQADLATSAAWSDPNPNVGDVVVLTIGLRNDGPDAATGVVVGTSGLPSGFQFVSATPSRGAYDPATNQWTVGTVATDTPETLTITGMVTSPTLGSVTASVVAADQYDPDPADNASQTP